MLAMLAFTACSSNNDEAVNTPQFWHVTLTASMGDETTRALSENGNAIIASFEVNDELVVVDADGINIVGTLTAQSEGTSTTLTGDLNASTLTVGEEVKVRYRSATANYDGQVGTLAGIATNQDYAEGTLTVSATDPLTFTSTNVTLSPKQSITKFSFTDGTNPVSVKTFGIAATGLVQSIATNATETVGAVTGTLATASADVYVALRNNVDGKQTYSFMVQDDAGNWYTGTKNAKLTNGKNYTATVTLTKLETLTGSSNAGDIGVIGGLPAIVVEINSVKKAVALMNTGALCPEDYGTYYTFDNRASGLSNGWEVPSQAELTALAAKTNAWGTLNGVNGCTFTIGSNTLFLPAAGLFDNDPNPATGLSDVFTHGYYWSSTSSDANLALKLCFYKYDDVDYDISIGGEAKVDALTVRPFHTLQ